MFFLEVRIISPTGRLLTVNRAVPIVETIFDFNGESRFLGDICRNGIIMFNIVNESEK